MKNHASRIVQEAILALKKRGVISPEKVVQAARDPKSPLHSRFTWDDTDAAHQYRLVQARNLIRVCVSVLPGTNQNERVFVSLSRDSQKEGGGYRVTADVLSDAELREELLSEALKELDVFKQKYARLSELSLVFSAIAKTWKKL
jgi:hypothetical protein